MNGPYSEIAGSEVTELRLYHFATSKIVIKRKKNVTARTLMTGFENIVGNKKLKTRKRTTNNINLKKTSKTKQHALTRSSWRKA